MNYERVGRTINEQILDLLRREGPLTGPQVADRIPDLARQADGPEVARLLLRLNPRMRAVGGGQIVGEDKVSVIQDRAGTHHESAQQSLWELADIIVSPDERILTAASDYFDQYGKVDLQLI